MLSDSADAIVIGGGLAGLVAAAELADAGKSVILVDQEPEQNLGGQGFWSFGGLFFVNSPEQRRIYAERNSYNDRRGNGYRQHAYRETCVHLRRSLCPH